MPLIAFVRVFVHGLSAKLDLALLTLACLAKK
jgi:hypothetical protein